MTENKTILAGIIGATGYAGEELARILLSHPNAQLAAASSVSFTGQRLCDVYPSLYGVTDIVLEDEDAVVAKSDVVFASLPAGLSEPLAQKCVAKGAVFIDLGADFRLEDAEVYEKWYKKPVTDKNLHARAVYGLPELSRAAIRTADIIGNPGCYPTSIALGCAPAILSGAVSCGDIIIDSKSGVTGAGRGLTQNTHFPDCNESFAPYKVGAHRHTPEIEQTLTRLAKRPVTVTFVPHLLPVNRGIVSTVYLRKNDFSLEEIHRIYTDFYAKERFVRVRPLGVCANLKDVRMSNFCDISLHEDAHTGRLIIVSAIDNMVKGAAGQAVQNMNIRFGLDEAAGLTFVPPAF